MSNQKTEPRLAEIQARVEAKDLTPAPWRLSYEQCDCGGDYPCGHGSYPSAVVTDVPTPWAVERAKQTGEPAKDYDFHRSEMPDFTNADWELMAHAREDVPALLEHVVGQAAEIERLRSRIFELAHRKPSAQRCTACGHTGIVHNLPEPRGCMADIASCPCPGWAAPCTYPNGPCVCPGTEDIARLAATGAPAGPERVVICGSTRYSAEMAAIEQLLTWRGLSVFAPTKCDLKSPNPLWDDPAERAAGAARLADLHAAMIRDAHWVLIVGPYAGDSTRGEIAHANALGKPVRFTDPGVAAEFGGEVWKPETAATA